MQETTDGLRPARGHRTQAALQKLELGIEQLIESGNWQAYLKTQSRFHNYSFNNTLLILFQMPTATRITRFRTWKQLGRSVRKGEKAIWILAPITYKHQQANEEATEQNGVQVLRGFKSVPVFDICQTDGEPLLEAPLQKLEGEDQGLFSALRHFSESRGWSVVVRPLDNANGYCHYGTHHIAIDSRLSPLHQAKTLAHEVAHSFMHSPEDYQLHRADKELEAESVAFCVLNHFGLDS
jgi:antirestriction protein ArdC